MSGSIFSSVPRSYAALRLTSMAVALLFPMHALAGVTWQLVEVPITPAAIAEEPALSGARTTDVLVTFTDGDRFNVAGILLEPVGGARFYQHPFGIFADPPPSAIAAFPAIEFDTYLTVLTGASISVGPSYVGTVPSFNDVLLNRAWAVQSPSTGPTGGPFRIARLTVIDGMAVGRIEVRTVPNPNTQFFIPLSLPIPEPVGALLVAAGVAVVIARRK